MSFLKKWKKSNQEEQKQEKVVQQDLDEKKAMQPGAICPMHLFFRKKVALPPEETVKSVLEKHLGEATHFSYSNTSVSFAPAKYQAEFKDATVPPLLTMTECMDARNFHIGEIERSQFWDCEESEQILSECGYQIIAVDMMGGGLRDYKERANMLMDYMEALVELYPDCAAVYFQNSGKMFTREKILNHQIPRDDRFIYFAVNVRFFNIQGTNDHIVDSVGMSTLYLPDVQYHFRDLGAGRDLDVNWVINHAFNVLCYIYANQCPFKSGDTVDAICLADGSMDTHTQWKVQYENALIQPVREVLDICMNEYAAGTRQ